MSGGPPRGPLPTTDVIIEITPAGRGDGSNQTTREPKIVLIRRKNPPHGWALPGGFLDAGERAADGARREAAEETGLDVQIDVLLGVYSDPKRDPRGMHTMSIVFVGHAEPGAVPRGGDDAAEAAVFALDELPDDLVFDHPLMIEDYRRWRSSGRLPPPDR